MTAAPSRTRSIEARHYTARDRRAWDELIDRSRTAHFLFKRGYVEYHADRFEDHSLLLHDGDRLVAVLPANRSGDALASHGGLTFGGVISDRRMTATTMIDVFDAVLAHLRTEGIREWLYKPVPHIYSAVPAEEDLYALFRHGARLVRRDISSAIRLDARLPYSKGRRHSVKRAAGAGLEIEPGHDFAEFMALEAEVLAERHGTAPTHTGPELQLLAGRFPDNIKLHTARRDGRLLAGVVVYQTANVAHTQYIAASDEGREIGAADAILDRLIAEHEAAGTPWFDFGISTEDGGRRLNEGLGRNKESYGARAVAYDCYEIPVT